MCAAAVFIETVKQAIGSTGRVTNIYEKAQSGINALKLVETLTDIKLLLKRRADASGHAPQDLLVTLDRFALFLTIEKARVRSSQSFVANPGDVCFVTS